MKKFRLLMVIGAALAGLYACNKNSTFTPTGGLLPTNYVRILDSSFSPQNLIVANGSSITFLNGTVTGHTIMSDDSTSLPAVLIKPDSSYFFKPDTATTVPVPIIIRYHCVEHASARGIITLNQ